MMTFLRKFGTSATIDFILFDPSGANIVTSAQFVPGDVVIKRDGQPETSAVFTPIDDGSGYYLILSASELEARRVKIFISDLSDPKIWLDHVIIIETYGSSASEHNELITFGNSVDSVTIETLLENLLAHIKGQIGKTGNRLDFYKQNSTDVAYSLSANNTQRIRL